MAQAAPQASPISSPSTKRGPSWRALLILVGLLTVVVVVGLTLLDVPVSQSFAWTIYDPGFPMAEGFQVFSFPAGSHVEGSWSVSIGGPATWFTIGSMGEPVTYQVQGLSGNFSFTSTYPTYDFVAMEVYENNTPENVSVSGTYSYSPSIL